MKRFLPIIVFVSCAGAALSAEQKQTTMYVKQKDGTYKCSASGRIEKEPCCDTPTNEPSPTPKPKR
ncbi:MAG: hypothetical protein M3Y69_06665 [Verrucomicrobiota bacterium]|nr:hypothetical protein [Verrucomicrobiota bacterium]